MVALKRIMEVGGKTRRVAVYGTRSHGTLYNCGRQSPDVTPPTIVPFRILTGIVVQTFVGHPGHRLFSSFHHVARNSKHSSKFYKYVSLRDRCLTSYSVI